MADNRRSPREFHLHTRLNHRRVDFGRIFYEGRKYIPWGNTPYDGSLDGLYVVIQLIYDEGGRWDDSMIKVIDMKDVYDKRNRGAHVFSHEELDKHDGVPKWYWWIRED